MLWQEIIDLVGHEQKDDKKMGGDWVGSGRELSGKKVFSRRSEKKRVKVGTTFIV